MERRMNTSNYYTIKQCNRIFNSIENPNWRIFKLSNPDGSCIQNSFSITNPNKLFKFISQCENPSALYVSISTFLKPESNHGFFINQKKYFNKRYIYPRAGYTTSDSILIDTYFFIDLDSENDLRIAQKDGRKIVNKLKDNPKLSLYEITFSGNKGIHLLYKMKLQSIADPAKRIKYIQKQKEIILNEILKLKLKTMNPLHEGIVKDVFRVRACPHSIKSSGNVVQPLDLNDFMKKDIYTLISIHKPREAKANDMKVATVESFNTTVSGKGRAGLISSQLYYMAANNFVYGIKDQYVTVLKHRNNKFNIHVLKNIQKRHQLSDFYTEVIGDYTYSYNSKLVDFPKLIKIMRQAKSLNLRWFFSRKHVPIQLTDSFDNKKNRVHQKITKEIIKSDYGQGHDHSKFHSELWGLHPKGNLIGKDNKVYDVRITVTV